MPSPMDGIKASIRARENRQRQNALREIFARNFEPGPDPTTPGKLNTQNVLAEMYQSGFGPEAFQIERGMRAKSGEGFTLSPGQRRYGPRGQLLAEVPAAQKELKPEERPGPAGRPPTKGDLEIDKKFAQEYVDFKAAGGYADIEKTLGQLSDVAQQLASPEGQDYTGALRGKVPDFVRTFTNPEAIAARDAVEEVVQRNLRLILGAQFTEKEGERLIKRAYNESLSPAENKKRVDRLMKQIQTAALQKQSAVEYFDKFGTLQGFKGSVPQLSDFENLFPDDENRSVKPGDVVDGPDGLPYVVLSVKPDGTPDDVQPAGGR